jgi:hypothetical protein
MSVSLPWADSQRSTSASRHSTWMPRGRHRVSKVRRDCKHVFAMRRISLAHCMAAHEEIKASELSHGAGMACRRFWRCVPDVGRNYCIKVVWPEVHELYAWIPSQHNG